MTEHAKRFDHIYRHNVWRQGSGPGSAEDRTRDYRWFVTNFMHSNGIKTVVDVGCGDWQMARHMDWRYVQYTGVDVSEAVLETTRQFAQDNIRFLQLDASIDPLPSADLLIMKDVLQHWPNETIRAFFPKLQGFKYALLTNGVVATSGDAPVNSDIAAAGGYRPIDLRLPPFSLKAVNVFWFMPDVPRNVVLWTRDEAATEV